MSNLETKVNNKKNFNNRNFKRPRRQKHVPEELSRDSLRKKIRDTKRLLRKDTLDANVRQELERSLKAYEIEFENKSKITAKINVEEKYAEKYKFVKFLEFKKANKIWTKTKNQLENLDANADPKKRESLEKQLQKYILDLNYIEHFPKDQKYISLYPKTKITNENIIKKRNDIRSSIQKAVKSGELLDVTIPRNRKMARKSLIKGVNATLEHNNIKTSKKDKSENKDVEDTTMNDDFFNNEETKDSEELQEKNNESEEKDNDNEGSEEDEDNNDDDNEEEEEEEEENDDDDDEKEEDDEDEDDNNEEEDNDDEEEKEEDDDDEDDDDNEEEDDDEEEEDDDNEEEDDDEEEEDDDNEEEDEEEEEEDDDDDDDEDDDNEEEEDEDDDEDDDDNEEEEDDDDEDEEEDDDNEEEEEEEEEVKNKQQKSKKRSLTNKPIPANKKQKKN
ncbi:hypothetical protein BCR32DRAFT_271862 [Anaeromyces robustus]|uniref:Uncharacterized protein n=1 Tax=Anaeromyces robustus TaxID=1754192 RepID=A0A1Y1WQF7_9FUNG|nr:hypothetical protein BCR32DRAFT_271862 [Anaeromyces robustus]|eukprot:ORX75506.1 hypothetical protein BCR32DRAFT_271862 [Anaeromyces robustus]